MDSIAWAKEQAQTPPANRSGLRKVLARAARKFSGSEDGKKVTEGKGGKGEVSEKGPCDVYVVGNQVALVSRGGRV